jgi:hypothetical protein
MNHFNFWCPRAQGGRHGKSSFSIDGAFGLRRWGGGGSALAEVKRDSQFHSRKARFSIGRCVAGFVGRGETGPSEESGFTAEAEEKTEVCGGPARDGDLSAAKREAEIVSASA